MTAAQAIHLIEQFAAQSPFAIWITDSRGVAIFANRKLHEIFNTQEHPSGALGMNLFDERGIAMLGLEDVRDRIKAGETVSVVVEAPQPEGSPAGAKARRDSRFILRVTAYPLFSSTQKIEHYVFLIQDVSATYAQREHLHQQVHDIEIFKKSKETRASKMGALQAEIDRLESEIRSRGAEPVA